VSETTDWSPHWVNDRIYPYRPFTAVAQASQIDTILTRHFPDFYPCRRTGT